jgi:hypothetical protein
MEDYQIAWMEVLGHADTLEQVLAMGKIVSEAFEFGPKFCPYLLGVVITCWEQVMICMCVSSLKHPFVLVQS